MLDSGEFASAETAYSELVAAGPDDPRRADWLVGRGLALLGLGRFDEALASSSLASAAAVDERQRSRSRLLEAMAESASGNPQRCARALSEADPESLGPDEADRAEALASTSTSSLSTPELRAMRDSGWLEPWVLLELSTRYASEGDADRSALCISELDRLYPGFRERHGGPGPDIEGPDAAYIALLLPLTGDGSAYAWQIRKGVELAFQRSADLYAGLPELSVRDTGGSDSELLRLAEGLGNDPNCVAVLGPMTTDQVLFISGTAASEKLPFLSPSATSAEVDEAGEFVHRLAPAASDEAVAMAEYAVQEAGCRRLAILHSYTSGSVAQAEQFEATIEDLGATVVSTRGFNTDDTDFRSQITSIRAAGADGIFLPVSAYEAIQIAPQLKFYSVDLPIFGTSGWDNELVTRMGGDTVEGAVFTCSFGASSLYPPTARFVFHYRRANGEDPSLLAAQGYDAASLLLSAWSDGCTTRDALEARLDRSGVLSGAAGRSTVGARTDVRSSYPMVTITDGEIVGLE